MQQRAVGSRVPVEIGLAEEQRGVRARARSAARCPPRRHGRSSRRCLRRIAAGHATNRSHGYGWPGPPARIRRRSAPTPSMPKPITYVSASAVSSSDSQAARVDDVDGVPVGREVFDQRRADLVGRGDEWRHHEPDRTRARAAPPATGWRRRAGPRRSRSVRSRRCAGRASASSGNVAVLNATSIARPR